MFIKLFFLFTIVPFVELALLLEVGNQIGAFNTIAIVLLTGFAGAVLARSQGFGILRRIQDELGQNQLPGDSLIEGALILAGGLLLLTPGLITDAFGFCLLLPLPRRLFKAYLKEYFRGKNQNDEIHMNYRVEE